MTIFVKLSQNRVKDVPREVEWAKKEKGYLINFLVRPMIERLVGQMIILGKLGDKLQDRQIYNIIRKCKIGIIH